MQNKMKLSTGKEIDTTPGTIIELTAEEMKEVTSKSVVLAENKPLSFMDMIQHAVSDPSFDADKLDKLISANERVEDRNAAKAYDAAMIRLQDKLSTAKITKSGKIEFAGKDKKGADYSQRTPYARLDDIDKVLRPLMREEGFVVTYLTKGTDRVVVKCKITHQDGHSEVSSMALPLDTSGSKNNLQGAGSSISYGRRYTLCAMLNLITVGEDDDGLGGPITDDQAAEIKQLLQETGMDVIRFLKVIKAESVEEIKTRDYASSIQRLEAYGFKKKKESEKKKPE